jgi:spermidine synthase
LLATCPDASLRNGAEAVALADRARQLTDGKDPAVLDTLSAAYAEKGSFAQAIDTEEQAVDLATQEGDTALAGRLKIHLARYESNEPLREGPSRASF